PPWSWTTRVGRRNAANQWRLHLQESFTVEVSPDTKQTRKPLQFLFAQKASLLQRGRQILISVFETTRLSSSNQQQFTSNTERTLIYKAILIGKLGQAPIPKKLKSGRIVTLLSVGTGGIRNYRRPLDNEKPRGYANHCAVQWHRVSLYPERLGELAVKNFATGSILYVEGNLETKIFNDPISGLIRQIREIAVRGNVMDQTQMLEAVLGLDLFASPTYFCNYGKCMSGFIFR
ncbi:uncharacterized protein LOC142554324, partial [Primulina tabacum]|uniref:uncharacterized protein LOC142554324 n=1 Tax=Primulina tabacum TaxID=48773 RepID=UPI003F5AA142